MASYALPNPINDNVSTLHREWESGKGFLPQSVPVPPAITTTPNPSKNFPRTGFDGAFFDLTIAGATAADVISASGSTVSTTSGSGVTLELTANPGGAGTNILRVTLAGPSFSSPPTAAFIPSTFKLYAGAGQTNEIYSFELSKWFIAHSSLITQTAAKNYCNSLALLGNYRLPSLGDYTNSKRVDDLMSWSCTLSGWSNNKYARAIGSGSTVVSSASNFPQNGDGRGGLFAEWGGTHSGYYTSSAFMENKYYWSINQVSSSKVYSTNSSGGQLSWGLRR